MKRNPQTLPYFSLTTATLIVCLPWIGIIHKKLEGSFGWHAVVFRLMVFSFIGSFLVFALSVAGSLRGQGRRTLCAASIGFVAAVLYGAINIAYIGSMLSNSFFGENLTLDSFRLFLVEPNTILHAIFTISTARSVLFASIFWAFISFCAVMIASSFTISFVWLAKQSVVVGITAGRRLPKIIYLVLLFVGLPLGICSLQAYSRWSYLNIDAYQEPVISLLMRGDEEILTKARLAAIEQDRISRPKSVPTPFDAKNVILIISDALRADHMGVYGYAKETTPFLSSLLSRGLLHRVEVALSSCSESYCGIVTTLASRPYHQVSPYNYKLNTFLRDAGYWTAFFLSGPHSSPRNLALLHESDVDALYYPVEQGSEQSEGGFDDRNLLLAARRLPRYSGRPVFFYFHLMSTHQMGVRSDKFQKFLPEMNLIRYWTAWNQLEGSANFEAKYLLNGLNQEEQTLVSNRYDNGVLQSDAYMSEIFDIMEKKGYLRNSIVLIIGDHGDGLGEHHHLAHRKRLFQEDIRIPLLIFDRDISVYRNSEFATQIDIAPTIADRLSLPIPKCWQGRSLLNQPGGRITFHQSASAADRCYALVSREFDSLKKYLRCESFSASTEAVFDLRADPSERSNLVSKQPLEAILRYRSLIEELR